MTTQTTYGATSGPIGTPLTPEKTELAVTRPTSDSLIAIKASIPQSEHPLDLPGFDVRAGQATCKVLKGRLSRLSDEESTLTLSFRLINDGPESVLFSDSLFRLVADGVPLAPTEFSNYEWVAREASKDGDVSFVIPRSCRDAVLRVGHPPQQSEHAIQLSSP